MQRSGGGAAATAVEVAGWGVALWVLWLLLIGPVDGWELAVGGAAALLAGLAAHAARRAVAER
ncbi:hypothetical protein [Streptomyces sp. NPDC050560]|uniref:hypothetical protein n=1 Tax=Streptomyces sp. NPDC050560 TaxID=3365630 RepID=UPI0037B6B935